MKYYVLIIEGIKYDNKYKPIPVEEYFSIRAPDDKGAIKKYKTMVQFMTYIGRDFSCGLVTLKRGALRKGNLSKSIIKNKKLAQVYLV